MKTPVAIADDQQLFLRSLCTLVNTFDDFTIVAEALNGEELLKQLATTAVLPEIILLDVNMPVMDGPATALVVTEKYPGMKVIALSMKDDDVTIIGMLKAGCCAYLLKEIHPDELEKALGEVSEKGYHNANVGNVDYGRLILNEQMAAKILLSEREHRFLKLAGSDLTYKQIASQMNVAERTVDG